MVGRVLAAIPVPSFMRRRASECMAVLFVVIGVLLSAALMSYHAGDPSFNRAGIAPVENALGSFGASLADVLKQTIGWMSALTIVAMFGWAWRLILKDETIRVVWRFIALMMAIISGSTLLALLAAGSGAPWLREASGAIGIVIGVALVPAMTSWGLALAAGLVFLATLPIAIGLRFHEWVALWIVLKRAMLTGWVATLGFVGWLRSPAAEDGDDDEDDEEDEDEDSFDLDDDDEDDEEDDEDEEEDLLGPRIESKPKKRIEAKKAKKSSDQSALDLRAKKGAYTMPSLSMMQKPTGKGPKQLSESALEQNARLLESVLEDFGVKGEITRVRPGPVVTLYELAPAPGIKSSRVIGLADDIARSMSAISARISVIPGQNVIGIELPNTHREMVLLRELLEDDSYEETQARLPLVLGKDISGEPIIADLSRMPHVLVAGTTGSGKSVAINTMIMSLIYNLTPEQCKFIMIDPKMLELSVYDNIPHLLSPVVTEPGKAVVALKWAVKEMENRYRLMSNLGVRNIDGYNKRIEEALKKGEELTRSVQTGFDPETGKPIMEKQPLEMVALPFIVIIVDEMADLMLVAGKEIESSVQRLAQMARAAGIHIIMATQRPSVDVITGVIKANFPTRISFQVTSKIDSRTILGEQGAEQLLGQGDMLYMAGGGRITRVHGPFITDKEVENIVAYLRTQGEPTYDMNVTFDEEAESENGELFDEDESEADRALYKQAVDIVLREQKASTSYVQRRLKIGYNRAARIIEKMEAEGLVGAPNHVGKREVLERA
jgi:S-DNA-T family DNA segregation ATPase FtsK/SpoIIIE